MSAMAQMPSASASGVSSGLVEPGDCTQKRAVPPGCPVTHVCAALLKVASGRGSRLSWFTGALSTSVRREHKATGARVDRVGWGELRRPVRCVGDNLQRAPRIEAVPWDARPRTRHAILGSVSTTSVWVGSSDGGTIVSLAGGLVERRHDNLRGRTGRVPRERHPALRWDVDRVWRRRLVAAVELGWSCSPAGPTQTRSRASRRRERAPQAHDS